MTLTDLPHSMTEHIADGVVHVIGVALAVAAVTGLLVWASLSVPGQHIWPLAVYAVGLLASFSFSAAYNLTLHARARAVLRRFDHAAIYLLIAGTYTPMALLGMGNTVGVALLVIVWTLSGIGIALKLGWIDRWPRTGFLLYLSLGWIGAIAACPTLSAMPGAALALLLAGVHRRDDLPHQPPHTLCPRHMARARDRGGRDPLRGGDPHRAARRLTLSRGRSPPRAPCG